MPAPDRKAVGLGELGLASFPGVMSSNPYQRLLYEQLAAHGFVVDSGSRFELGYLWRARRTVRFLHFHWPQSYWRHASGPRGLRRPLSLVKVGLFAARLVAARLLGYRIVWTVHQVYPHERWTFPVDRLGALALARLSHVRIAHDAGTQEAARRDLGRAVGAIEVIPHGSYIGVYPPGRPRAEVRAELGLPEDAFVFLCFGELRAYKEVKLLLEAFAATALPSAALVVAGAARSEEAQAPIREAARRDRRVRPLLDFVPEERVAELFGAADAAVFPRGDGGTSGALILSLSLGLPVVAAAAPVYRELLGDGRAGWLFRPHDGDSLRAALEAAAADASLLREKGAAALGVAETLQWPQIGGRTAALLQATVESHDDEDERL